MMPAESERPNSPELDLLPESSTSRSRSSLAIQMEGTALFVFGRSIAKNDAHVFNMIGRGKIAHMFVSLHGDPASKSNVLIQTRIEQIVDRKSTRLNSS